MRNLQKNFSPNNFDTKKRYRLNKIQEGEFLEEISDDISSYSNFQGDIGNTIGSVQKNIINIYNSNYKRPIPRKNKKEQFPILYKGSLSTIDESDFIKHHVSIHKGIYLKKDFYKDNTNLDATDAGILKNFISHISTNHIKTGEVRTKHFSYPILDTFVSSLICGLQDPDGSMELTYTYIYDDIKILGEALNYLKKLKVKNTIDLECVINLIKIKIRIHELCK